MPRERPADAQAVLDFWFGPTDSPEHGRARGQWFRKDAGFDADIARRFGPLIETALAGGIDDWAQGDADTALARILVLDQFTRNVFRGTARAFAGDAQALTAARALIAQGADRTLGGVQRQFCYLPLEHAEDLACQREALRLFGALAADDPRHQTTLDWARRHLAVIERFGRFPHRNALLGRTSTAEERAYLAEPGSGF